MAATQRNYDSHANNTTEHMRCTQPSLLRPPQSPTKKQPSIHQTLSPKHLHRFKVEAECVGASPGVYRFPRMQTPLCWNARRAVVASPERSNPRTTGNTLPCNKIEHNSGINSSITAVYITVTTCGGFRCVVHPRHFSRSKFLHIFFLQQQNVHLSFTSNLSTISTHIPGICIYLFPVDTALVTCQKIYDITCTVLYLHIN